MRYNTAPGGSGSDYWWPRRKSFGRREESGRRMYNGQVTEGKSFGPDSQAGLIGTFHLHGSGSKWPEKKLKSDGETDPGMSFDVHMKRRKYAEELAAKSIKAEEIETLNPETASPSKEQSTVSNPAEDYDNWVLDSHVEIWRQMIAHMEKPAQKDQIEQQVTESTAEDGELKTANSPETPVHEENIKTELPLDSITVRSPEAARAVPAFEQPKKPAILLDSDQKSKSSPDSMQNEDAKLSRLSTKFQQVANSKACRRFVPMLSPQEQIKEPEPQSRPRYTDEPRQDLELLEATLRPDFTALAERSSMILDQNLEDHRPGQIHILGMGPVGKYIGHALSRLHSGPPVTLLMHRPLLMQQWHDEGAAIRVFKDNEILVATGFNVESSAPFGRGHPHKTFPGFGERLEHTAEQPKSVIKHLIVTTNPSDTLAALTDIRHRIRKSTTICLVQDGLGMVEKLNASLFPDPHRRPTFVLGNIKHDLVSTEHLFTLIEKRSGTITCSKLPHLSQSRFDRSSAPISRHDFSWSDEARHLVTSLYRAPELHTKAYGHRSFYREQLIRLAADAVIGPLTVAFDCRNDQLLYNFSASSTMKLLIGEISTIILSLPEIRSLRKIKNDFSPKKLEARIISIISTTGMNHSYMQNAVRAGQRTNIEFINGYLMKRAAEMGIPSPLNEMVMHMVKGKQAMRNREKNGYMPFVK